MNYDNMDLVSDKILLADGSIISAVDGSTIAGADADRAQLYNTMPLIAAKLLQPDGSIINGSDGAIVAAADPDRASLYAAMPVTAVRYVTEGGTVLAGVGGAAQVSCEPDTTDFFADTPIMVVSPLITSLTINVETMHYGIAVMEGLNIEALSFPNLTSIDGVDSEQAYGITLSSLNALTTLDLPLLVTAVMDNVDNYCIKIESCPALTSVDLSSLTTVGKMAIGGTGLTILDLSSLVTMGDNSEVSGNLSLTNIVLTNWVPTNGHIYTFSDNALTAAAVNAILARCVANTGYVSGTIALLNMAGGTNAEPTGQGLIDAATLEARGVTVSLQLE